MDRGALLGLSRVVLAVLALLALACGGALKSAIKTLTIFLQTIGFLAVADPFALLQLEGSPVLLLGLPPVLAACAFAELIAFSSCV